MSFSSNEIIYSVAVNETEDFGGSCGEHTRDEAAHVSLVQAMRSEMLFSFSKEAPPTKLFRHAGLYCIKSISLF